MPYVFAKFSKSLTTAFHCSCCGYLRCSGDVADANFHWRTVANPTCSSLSGAPSSADDPSLCSSTSLSFAMLFSTCTDGGFAFTSSLSCGHCVTFPLQDGSGTQTGARQLPQCLVQVLVCSQMVLEFRYCEGTTVF